MQMNVQYVGVCDWGHVFYMDMRFFLLPKGLSFMLLKVIWRSQAVELNLLLYAEAEKAISALLISFHTSLGLTWLESD